MARLPENSTASSHLGDFLVGQVFGRRTVMHHQPQLHHGLMKNTRTAVLPTTRANKGMNDTMRNYTPPRDPERQYSKYYNTPARRLQCRTNQARYRNRQRDYQAHLEENVRRLREELDGLKRRRQNLKSLEKNNENPWLVVTKAVCFIEKRFQSPWSGENDEGMSNSHGCRHLGDLEPSFSHDIFMGNVCGLDAVMEQLQCYSQYFGFPQIQLRRVEERAPGVLTATARLSLTITELTLRRLFPLISREPRSKYDTNWGDRLVGQRLECSCSLNFLFDDTSGRVMRLETQIGFIPAMFRVLRTADAVSEVMEGALISPDGVIHREEVSGDVTLEYLATYGGRQHG